MGTLAENTVKLISPDPDFTSPTEPFRFSLDFQPTSTKKHPKCPKEPDSPNPRSLALTSPTLLAKKRLAVLNASNNFGHTSRRTISRTPKTNNSSTPTRKWQRFLEATASVPSVWPSSFPLTCLKLLSNLYIPPHSWNRSDIWVMALHLP